MKKLLPSFLVTAALSVPGSASAAGLIRETIACKADVMSLCHEFVPNHDAIIACMQKKHANLSPGCAAVFDDGMRKRAAGDPTG
jgi:hypothetical protein